MRTIKFRVWDNKLNLWVNNIGMGKNNILTDGTEKRFIVMQFTGLTDRNGKEIFEGDICVRYLDEKKVYTDGKTWKDYWLIEWLDKTAGFTTTKISNYSVHFKKMMPVGRKQNSFSTRFNEVEVIGNIHENPELIS